MKTVKIKKRKEIYSERYNKGTVATNREQIIAYIKKAEFVFVNRQAKYDDDTQSITITVEINSIIAKKIIDKQ